MCLYRSARGRVRFPLLRKGNLTEGVWEGLRSYPCNRAASAVALSGGIVGSRRYLCNRAASPVLLRGDFLNILALP